MAAAKIEYVRCEESDIPEAVRFDVPARNQGQMVEVAYGGFFRAEHGHGDLYQRVTDRSDRSVAYYRRADHADYIRRRQDLWPKMGL